MEMYELCPGLLVRDGRTLLKVSSVYPTYVTAQVMLEGGKAPSRTKVRRYTASYIELYFDEATDGLPWMLNSDNTIDLSAALR